MAAPSGCRRLSPVAARLLLVVALVATGACSTERDPTELPGITPPAPRGRPVEVDVCSLLPTPQASELTGRELEVVGVRVEAARLETARCEFGVRFADPVLSLALTTDPVSQRVFESAYGSEAGGDPVAVKAVGVPTFLRTESNDRSMHSYADGAVLTVRTDVDSAEPVLPPVLAQLMRLAVRRLPNNPVLKELAAPTRCAGISEAAVEAALGRPPTLVQEFDAVGAVECSWGGQPGSVVVTVRDDRRALKQVRQLVDSEPYAPVPGLRGGFSSDDESGDLLVLDRARVFEITVVPAAGYFGPDVPTTDDEKTLAQEARTGLR